MRPTCTQQISPHLQGRYLPSNSWPLCRCPIPTGASDCMDRPEPLGHNNADIDIPCPNNPPTPETYYSLRQHDHHDHLLILQPSSDRYAAICRHTRNSGNESGYCQSSWPVPPFTHHRTQQTTMIRTTRFFSQQKHNLPPMTPNATM